MVAEDDYEDDDYEYEEDEEPRRSRGLLVVGALVGAIALGGGLAYGYKTFMGTSGSGSTPIVKAERAPAKTPPSDPGGKQFANADRKIMGQRLTEASRDTAATRSTGLAGAATSGESGVRRVPIIPVNPDGSIAPPSSNPAAAAPADAPPGLSVTGPIRIGTPVAPSLPGPQRVAVSPVGSAPVGSAPVPQVKTITLTQSSETPAPPAEVALPQRAPQTPARQAAALRATAPARSVPVATATVAAAAAAAAAPAAARVSSPRRYVAVLASQRSSMDALKTIADLQQKYAVLGGRTPSVQEANLGEKGIWHRVIVGPAGPKEEAQALCSQLKASGYSGCWPMAQK